MALFELVEGNPGALEFVRKAHTGYPILADFAFFRMERNGITGSALYMLWNDCCDRDTKMAVDAALYCQIDFIKNHINKSGGRGIRITSDDIAAAKNNKPHSTPFV